MKSPIVAQFDEQKAKGNLVVRLGSRDFLNAINLLNRERELFLTTHGRRWILEECCPVSAERGASDIVAGERQLFGCQGLLECKNIV